MKELHAMLLLLCIRPLQLIMQPQFTNQPQYIMAKRPYLITNIYSSKVWCHVLRFHEKLIHGGKLKEIFLYNSIYESPVTRYLFIKNPEIEINQLKIIELFVSFHNIKKSNICFDLYPSLFISIFLCHFSNLYYISALRPRLDCNSIYTFMLSVF